MASRARTGSASNLENAWVYYALVAIIGVGVVGALQRFHRSPIGSVLVAIRENEQRAQFVGYADAALQADRIHDLGDAVPASPACCPCFTIGSRRPIRSP